MPARSTSGPGSHAACRRGDSAGADAQHENVDNWCSTRRAGRAARDVADARAPGQRTIRHCRLRPICRAPSAPRRAVAPVGCLHPVVVATFARPATDRDRLRVRGAHPCRHDPRRRQIAKGAAWHVSGSSSAGRALPARPCALLAVKRPCRHSTAYSPPPRSMRFQRCGSDIRKFIPAWSCRLCRGGRRDRRMLPAPMRNGLRNVSATRPKPAPYEVGIQCTGSNTCGTCARPARRDASTQRPCCVRVDRCGSRALRTGAPTEMLAQAANLACLAKGWPARLAVCASALMNTGPLPPRPCAKRSTTRTPARSWGGDGRGGRP